MDFKRSFDIEKIHPNENINFFINISNSTQLVSPGILKNHSSLMKKFYTMIGIRLFNGEIPVFNLEDKSVKDLLLNTKNHEHYQEMPFDKMFIDITQEFEPGRGIKGHVGKYNSNGKIEKICIDDIPKNEKWKYEDGAPKATKCIMRGLFINNNIDNKVIDIYAPIEIIFTTRTGENYSMNVMWDSNIGVDLNKNTLPVIDDYAKEKIKEFICNILDFINHQEVELVCGEKHNRNDLRIKRGKVPLPARYYLVLKGKLKKYVNETIKYNEKAWELGHRFWVRGHWMEFKHKRYKNKQGQKIWVLPYIKGKGELIKKDYYIGEKEQCWENEKQMIKIVRELYPEHEIKTHDRTTLDGLEIDCYIPELKLGFEYNGRQHYEQVKIFQKTIEDFNRQKERDIEKIKRAESKGIKIIVIRYDEAVTKELISKKINQEESQ